MVADVSKLEDVRSFIGAVKRQFGAIHILINNAGAGIFRSVADLDAGRVAAHDRPEPHWRLLLLPRNTADIQAGRELET